MFDLKEMGKVFQAVSLGRIWPLVKNRIKKYNTQDLISFLEEEEKSVSDFINMIEGELNEIDFFEQSLFIYKKINALEPIGNCLRYIRTSFTSQINAENIKTNSNLMFFKALFAIRYALRYSINQIKKELDI